MAKKRQMMKGLNNPAFLATLPLKMEALALRQQGLNYVEIGQRLGMSGGQARHFVQQALDVALRAPAEELRQLELSRLDQLLTVWWPRAMTGVPVKDEATGEVFQRYNEHSGEMEPVLMPSEKALESVLKILSHRYKLTGLDRQQAREKEDDPRQVVLGILKQVILEEDGLGTRRETTLAVAQWRPASISGETIVVDGSPPLLPPPPGVDDEGAEG